MEDCIFRNATINDVPFLVDTIIEAEKSGTDKLSYSTIFGLSDAEARKYLTNMLLEEVDGCELSISSFLLAETNGIVVAAVSAWIEGIEGISSSILKGNLLSYSLPKMCIEKALSLNHFIRDLHIEYADNSIQLGNGHVLKTYRGNNLLGSLMTKKIELLSQLRPDISAAFAQVFECNTPSMRTCEKLNFKQIMLRESKNKEIINYLPYNKKVLFKKELFT
jgi:hypothetical protein